MEPEVLRPCSSNPVTETCAEKFSLVHNFTYRFYTTLFFAAEINFHLYWNNILLIRKLITWTSNINESVFSETTHLTKYSYET
jgi:hypothetical protein